MENNCVSLETARRLRAAGFVQRTHFWWDFFHKLQPFITDHPDSANLGTDDYVAAPTAQELFDVIGTGYLFEPGDNLAEALANLWLNLQEEEKE